MTAAENFDEDDDDHGDAWLDEIEDEGENRENTGSSEMKKDIKDEV